MALRIRRGTAASVAAIATLAVMPLTVANATSTFAFSRPFEGANRYDTAAKIANGSGFSNVANVVLATGEAFPDALAGSPLAAALDSPLLLVTSNSVPTPTSSALVALKATKVTLLGGTAAISADVERELRSRGYEVNRVSGIDRYATAAAAATAARAITPVGTVDGLRTAFLATGEGFADALAASPAAYDANLPIFLTTPGTLSPAAQQGIDALDIQQVVILGGTGAVSSTVETQVDAMPDVTSVRRLGGVDRTETATRVAGWAIEELAFSTTHVNLARGDQYADALAGGPHGGREKGATLLAASPSALDTSANANTKFLNAHSSTLQSGHIFGGSAAISPAVETAAEAAGGAAPPEAPAGQSTPDVKRVVVGENYFVSTVDRTYFYDANDTYRVKGASTNLAGFEAALSVGDRVTVTYDPNGTGTSVFDITNDTVVAPGKATAKALKLDNTATANDVRVTVTIPTGNAVGTTYTLQRARYSLPGCNALGSFSPVAGADISDGEAVDMNVDDGCYVYRVVAAQANGTTANGANSDNVTVPGPADTEGPLIQDVRATTDAGTAGTLDAGDVHTFLFNEDMHTDVDADGSTYRVSDADGTQVDIVCGAGKATCAYEMVQPVVSGGPNPVFRLRVTIQAPTVVSAGTVSGMAYSGTIVSVSTQWKDTTGNPLRLVGSDTTIQVAPAA